MTHTKNRPAHILAATDNILIERPMIFMKTLPPPTANRSRVSTAPVGVNIQENRTVRKSAAPCPAV